MEPTLMCRLCQIKPALENECACANCLSAWRQWRAQKQAMRAQKAARRCALAWLRFGPPWPDPSGAKEQ
jgi:hypothetical protein